METIRYISKTHTGEDILFFPDYEANPGNIACYAHFGQHGEAAIRYYHECKNADCKDLVKEYESLFDCKLVRVRRMRWKN